MAFEAGRRGVEAGHLAVPATDEIIRMRHLDAAVAGGADILFALLRMTHLTQLLVLLSYLRVRFRPLLVVHGRLDAAAVMADCAIGLLVTGRALRR